jgi:hypothetical protein
MGGLIGGCSGLRREDMCMVSFSPKAFSKHIDELFYTIAYRDD